MKQNSYPCLLISYLDSGWSNMHVVKVKKKKSKNLDWEWKLGYGLISYFWISFSSRLYVWNSFPVLTVFYSVTQEISILLCLYFHRNKIWVGACIVQEIDGTLNIVMGQLNMWTKDTKKRWLCVLKLTPDRRHCHS